VERTAVRLDDETLPSPDEVDPSDPRQTSAQIDLAIGCREPGGADEIEERRLQLGGGRSIGVPALADDESHLRRPVPSPLAEIVDDALEVQDRHVARGEGGVGGPSEPSGRALGAEVEEGTGGRRGRDAVDHRAVMSRESERLLDARQCPTGRPASGDDADAAEREPADAGESERCRRRHNRVGSGRERGRHQLGAWRRGR